MTEEIKEILDEMLWQFEKYPTDDFIVKNKESRILLNYITNLQKEKEELQRKYLTINENNQNMQEEMVRTWKKCDDYKQRNEKAVEYIKNTTLYGFRGGKTLLTNYLDDLLNILKGGDE